MQRKNKYQIFMAGLLILCLLFLSLPLVAVELPLEAESAILLDGHSGKILYEKNPHKVSYPASMTKLMTLVLAMEALEDGKMKMDDVVTASERASSYGGSQIFLAPGEKLTVKELLLGIALASGNDASVAIAEHLAGSHEGFVELMNKKAQELGLENTHFVNCNGLHDPNHYSTAYDFGKIALYALRFPQLREICQVKHYRIREETSRPFQYDNKNKLLWRYEGTDGFKTGWTSDAKYCLTATCERNGLRLVSVVMGVPVSGGHYSESIALFNWGYSQFAYKSFYKASDVVTQVQVGKGTVDYVDVIPEKDVGITLPKGKGKELETTFQVVPLINAPIKKGQILGYVSIVEGEQVLERINLLAKEDVEKGSLWREMKKIFTGIITK